MINEELLESSVLYMLSYEPNHLLIFSSIWLIIWLFCDTFLGLCPDWPNMNPADKVKNAKAAMDLAEKWLDIPQVSGTHASGFNFQAVINEFHYAWIGRIRGIHCKAVKVWDVWFVWDGEIYLTNWFSFSILKCYDLIFLVTWRRYVYCYIIYFGEI